MKKTIIASFVAAACVVSAPAFAASVNKTSATENAANSAITAQVNKAQATVDQNSATNDVSTFNWADRISVGGQANIDASYGNRTPMGGFGPSVTTPAGDHFGGSNKNSSDLNINNVNLFIDAKINSWVKAHINLAYLGDQGRSDLMPLDKVSTKWGDSGLDVDEAYVDIGNFARTPFYARLGKQYVGFGDYDRYPIITPFTQMFSQTRATAATVGLVTDMGFYANISGFQGGTDRIQDNQFGNDDRNIDNMSAKAGLTGSLHSVGLEDVHYNVDASYISNMYDTDMFSAIYNYGRYGGGYKTPVGGVSFHGDLAYGSFSVWGNYVSSLNDMKMYATPGGNATLLASAKLWAADVDAAYKFRTLGHNSKISASYQWTGNGDEILNEVPSLWAGSSIYSPIAQDRFQLGYDVDLWKCTNLGVAWAHDTSYKSSNGGDRRYSDEVVARLGVKF